MINDEIWTVQWLRATSASEIAFAGIRTLLGVWLQGQPRLASTLYLGQLSASDPPYTIYACVHQAEPWYSATPVGYLHCSGTTVYLASTPPATTPTVPDNFRLNWQWDIALRSASPAGAGAYTVRYLCTCYDLGGTSQLGQLEILHEVPGADYLGHLAPIDTVTLFSNPWEYVDAADPDGARPLPHSLLAYLSPRPSRNLATLAPTYQYDVRAVIMPTEGNLAVGQDGSQWLARRQLSSATLVADGEGYPTAQVTTHLYRRDAAGTDTLWTRLLDNTAGLADGGPLTPLCRQWLTRWYGCTAATLWTIDRGQTICRLNGEDSAQLALLTATPLLGFNALQVLHDERDALTGYVGAHWSSTDQLLALVTDGVSVYGPTQITSNCRVAGETGCLPQPHLWRNADGTWSVGALCGGGNWRSWQSADPFGLSWALIEEQTLDTWADLTAVQLARGRAGNQVAVGYTSDGQLTSVVRAGPTSTWSAGGTIGPTQATYPPYLYERGDGTWECGWYDTDSDHVVAYTAAGPADTWSFLSDEPALEGD